MVSAGLVRHQEKHPRWRWQVSLALALGLLLRLWFVWQYFQVSADSLMYGDLAQNLLKHGIYGRSVVVDGIATIRPTLIRLPGYPLFIAAVFAVCGVGKYHAVVAVQVLLDLWTCLLAAGTARRIFHRDQAFTATLWLSTLCPFMANYVAVPLTETATLWTIALAFYALVRWQDSLATRWLWLLGAALAWAVLLRPEQGMLAAVAVPAMVWIARTRYINGLTAAGRRSVGYWTLRVGLVCLLTVLPLVPWAARNWRTFHVVQPLAPRYATEPGEPIPYGFQRWFRTFAIDFQSTDQCYWLFDGDQIAIADLPNRAFDSNEQYEATAAVLAEYNRTTNATPELDRKFAAIAAERVKANPLRYYVALPVARVLNMIFRPRADMLPLPLEWWKARTDPLGFVFGMLYALLNLGYLVLAWLCLQRRNLWRDYQPIVWAMVASIVFRCLLLLTIDNSEPRYTLEFYPVLVVLAGGFVAQRHKTKAA